MGAPRGYFPGPDGGADSHAGKSSGNRFCNLLSVAIFGGTAPYLNTWLNSTGHGHIYLGYVMVLGLVACVASMMIRETAGVDLNDITVPASGKNGTQNEIVPDSV